MTFLKKLGLALAKGLQIVTGLGAAGVQIPYGQKITDTVQRLLDVIITTEALSVALGTPGPEKLKAAAPLVAQELLQAGPLVGKKIAKPELFQQGATKVADGLADVLNSLHEDEVKVEKVA